MRIGILTFHRSINYGAFMQCYALTRAIQARYGNIVEVIDFEKLSKHQMYQFGPKKFVQHGLAYKNLYKRFQDDLYLLPLSPQKFITDDYQEIYDYINNRYDLVIVGSDAVWAYKQHLGLRNPYWLGPEITCKKMSYAASAYSLDTQSLTPQEKEYIGQCLEGYEYIGVRDTETYNMVRNILPHLTVNINCDPTALLSSPNKDFATTILAREGVDLSKPIVTFMISGNKFVDTIKKELGNQYEYVLLLSRNRILDRFRLRNEKYLSNLSPLEWYTIFAYSYINITKYFHGTMLALKSNVPTLSFDVTNMQHEYVSKIRQVLTDMELSDFWINNNHATKKTVLDKIRTILEKHDIISNLIAQNMEKEKKKADSFFTTLDRIIKEQ